MEKSQKRLRFEKVASYRVQKVIDFLRSLQNCSNHNNYEYTIDDVDFMFGEINRVLKETRNVYENELNKVQKIDFKFK